MQPKRNWSKKRTRTAKSARWKAEAKNLAKCNKCGERVLPHTMCSNCGTYNGREIIKVNEDK